MIMFEGYFIKINLSKFTRYLEEVHKLLDNSHTGHKYPVLQISFCFVIKRDDLWNPFHALNRFVLQPHPVYKSY